MRDDVRMVGASLYALSGTSLRGRSLFKRMPCFVFLRQLTISPIAMAFEMISILHCGLAMIKKTEKSTKKYRCIDTKDCKKWRPIYCLEF